MLVAENLLVFLGLTFLNFQSLAEIPLWAGGNGLYKSLHLF